MAGTDTEKPLQPREFADKILAKALEDGRIAPDGSAKAAAVTPAFSKGTVPLDDNGQPIVPREQAEAPPFEAGHVALPEGSEAVQAPIAGTPEPVATAPAQAPADAAAGAAAAEATAAAIEEYEEFAFHDPDLDLDVPMRVPKKFAATAKRGYGSRASYDRLVTYLSNARPDLEPLIADGRIQRILPLLKAALSDEAYGQYVTTGFERLQKGLPLIEQARIEAAAAGAAQAAPPPEQFSPEGYTDPFTEVVNAQVKPIADQLQEIRAWQKQELERRQQTDDQARVAQEQNLRINSEMAGAHQDLARMYPGKFDVSKGPNDPMWQQALRFAKDAGYEGVYGLRGGAVFGGQQIIALDHERIAATASPAAQALAAADQQLSNAARREAAASAASVSGGGVATTTMPQAPPKPVPSYVNAEGKTVLKPREAFMAEIQDWHTKYGRLKT